MLIYKITNIVNRKSYIGQTERNIERRWYHHIYDSKNDNIYFHKAIRKYGHENFVIETLCECKSKEELNRMENLMIIIHKTHVSEGGYNLTWGGEGINGYHHIEETRKRMSERMSGKNHPLYGTHLSEATKEKLRTSHRGQIPWNKGKRGSQVAWNKGLKGAFHHTKESKEKLRAANLGKNLLCAHKKKIGDALRGKKKSPEHTEKNRSSHLRYVWNIISPDGKTYVTKNLSEFCREYGINRSNMVQVSKGRFRQCKGWKCSKC